ncbi:MAG: hypothetical protein K5695_08015 [Oscillospiraceae bacterium]|nr:hypothetical protein [Oscillospiraceae bacterium]
MNAEIKTKVEKAITSINKSVIAQMLNEEKNSYDEEIRLPENVTTPDAVHKRAYNKDNDTMDNAKNKKRRENRPSVLEQYVLEGENEKAKKYIRKQHYTAMNTVSQMLEDTCNEKTARKILKQMFTLVGYKAEMIPTVMVSQTIQCVKNWMPYSRTLYKYSQNMEMKPLNMNEDEMNCTYDTYILTKTILLINSATKEEYHNNIEKLNQKLKPVYAAIRALRENE